MNTFNLITCPLQGTHCISAGAGTGKTYAIAHLVLRLLLECELPLDSILVVTFTEAATEELQDRIRQLLGEALTCLDNPSNCTNDNLLAIITKQRQSKQVTSIRNLLERALYSFDESSVCTIHSFCHRILNDNAFESNVSFDTELVPNQDVLIRKAVIDFWRLLIDKESPLFIRFLLESNWNPKRCFDLVYNRLGQIDITVTPQRIECDTTQQENHFLKAFQVVSKMWAHEKEAIEQLLLTSNSLSRIKYNIKRVPLHIRAMDTYLKNDLATPSLFPSFVRFTASAIVDATKKRCDPIVHPFFDLCETVHANAQELQKVLQAKLVQTKINLFSYVKDQLDKNKHESNLCTFDDLLINLYQALHHGKSSALSTFIKSKYTAALIDEFQDTDPTQYAIFNALFSNSHVPLFLIGDPKQAIYSFRGADIFTFFKATEQSPKTNQHTLSTNYRSHQRLIKAFNTLFAQHRDTFIYPEIPYHTLDTPDSLHSDVALHIANKPICSSLKIIFCKKNESDAKPISKVHAQSLIGDAIIKEIILLLSKGSIATKESNKSVTPEMIAILVRTRAQARFLKEMLAQNHIPAVLHSAGNIFDTTEALTIHTVLSAIAHPKNHGTVKAALCTTLFDIGDTALFTHEDQQTIFEEYFSTFQRYYDLWDRFGFVRMMSTLFDEQQVRQRVLASLDGERQLTNFLHVQDLLSQKSKENHLAMPQLLNWFTQQLDPSTPRLEEHELRLEKDDRAVTIVTMHKSKGLEYPIVFCPFTWGSSNISDKEVLFHKSGQRIFDVGSDQFNEHKSMAEKELLAENIRLFYVACTRAKYRCYLYWGRFSTAETSAPAFIFHRPSTWNSEASLDDLERHVKSLDEAALYADLKALAKKSDQTIGIHYCNDEPATELTPPIIEAPTLTYRTFTRSIQPGKHVSSFSGLTHTTPSSTPFYESTFSPASTLSQREQTLKSIFTFPSGATSGSMIHSIFEKCDFTQAESEETSVLVTQTLASYGFDHLWVDVIKDMVLTTLAHPLSTPSETFSLSRILQQDTIRELEFYYPLSEINQKELQTLFKEVGYNHLATRMEELEFQPLLGYMHGFIDLVVHHNNKYYIIDWKSNHLGANYSDYDQQNIKKSMGDNNYDLQYLIYTLAVDRYLHSRLPHYSYAKNFGGVYYLFVRGLSDSPNQTGVFFDKPGDNIIHQLSKRLINP